MSPNAADRPIRPPPADFDSLSIPWIRQPVRNWFRVHQSKHNPDYFSINTGHRFSHRKSIYPLVYVGVDTATCLFERFADTAYEGQKTFPKSLWEAHSVSCIQIPELHVCDLTKAETLSALMVDLGTLMHKALAKPQAWGLAIQKHPSAFQGIKYRSRFNGQVCLALFKRDGVEKQLKCKLIDRLPDDDESVDWLETHGISLF